MIDVNLSNAALLRLLRSPNGPVADIIRRRGERVLNKAVETCPADTGELRNSLRLVMRVSAQGPYAQVGSNEKYAIFVHEGTGVFAGKGPIRPRSARVLRWPAVNNRYRQTGGPRRYASGATAQYNYAPQVAGMPGRPWLREALKVLG